MIFGFEHPWFALLGLSLPILALLYLWRRRSGRRIVPDLFLWDRPAAPARGGRRFQWSAFPLSFYLELLALAGLLGVAVAPYFAGGKGRAPLVVVLDNSFSLQVLGEDGKSVRDRLKEELEEALKRNSGRFTIFYRAGATPRLLSERLPPSDREWPADEPAADLAGTLAEARLRHPGAEFRVFTDHAPEFPLPDDTGWVAMGTARGNLGWTHLRRYGDRIFLEAVNQSDAPAEATVTITPGSFSETWRFAPREQKRLICRVDAPGTAVALKLAAPFDRLPFDNEATLLPEERPPVAVRLEAGFSPEAEKALKAALASPEFTETGNPELIVAPTSAAPGKFHRLFWTPVPLGRAVLSSDQIQLAPDSSVTRGLELAGIRWAADPELRLPGRTLLRRGNVALLTETRRGDGFLDYHLNLSPEGSNLFRHPFWPALFWNLAEALREERPGPERHNYRAGDPIRIKAPSPEVKSLRLTLPDGREEALPVIGQYAYPPSTAPGLYRVTEPSWEFRVAALSAEESDLSRCGSWLKTAVEPESAERSRKRLGWMLAALAALALVVHQGLLGRKRGEA